MKPDIDTPVDRGESISLMEPLRLEAASRHRPELTDLVVDLTAASTGLRRSLPDGIVSALATLVRSMNCYYSNLIEGHDTHPVDIERALNDDFTADPRRRDLQLEARAHIEVQRWIDSDGLRQRATSMASLQDIHRRFCERLPDALLWTMDPKSQTRFPVIPGALRQRDVIVGRHVPISPGALPRFLRRFEAAHENLGRVDQVIAAATAHHRLLWIHPFLDGNGRVARLMSYALLRDALDTGGLWSIARGLARQEQQYKTHLANCDLPRRNDLDGRGQLSEEALADFARFFLRTCIDQVHFMDRLMQPDRLRARILSWAEQETQVGHLPLKSGAVLEAVLYRGAVPRAEIPNIVGVVDRHARRITSALLESGVLVSAGPRAPLALAFPARLAGQWLPGLFPDAPRAHND